MSLKEDINAALEVMSNPIAPPLTLDEEEQCIIPVPVPAEIIELAEGLLKVKVKISGTGNFVTLSTPIAAIDQKASSEFFRALLYRQFYADQVQGASFAIDDSDDLLVAVYHWVLNSITPQEFTQLFKDFVSASIDLIIEVGEMSRHERRVKPIHKGRPR